MFSDKIVCPSSEHHWWNEKVDAGAGQIDIWETQKTAGENEIKFKSFQRYLQRSKLRGPIEFDV